MAKVIFILVVFIALGFYVEALSNDACPPSGKMTACTPKCKDDSECFGRKCCPNICNVKSCVPANLAGNSGGNGYKNSNTGATGSYCGNVKCNSYEKCELDKSSKRQKCVRQ